MLDAYGRHIDYLRISVTDRCNLRCIYCMPEEGVPAMPHEEILSFEEIERFVEAAAKEGITKLRLTGGEPLVRLGIVDHVRRLTEIPGIQSIAMTTNGILLPRYAKELVAAGLTRVNISLDSLDAETFRKISRGGKLDDVMAGIDAAFEAGMDPVKLNVVVVRRLHQDLLGFAKLTMERPLHIRFIEYMPVGTSESGQGGCSAEGDVDSGWTEADHVPSDEVLERLAAEGKAAGLGELQHLKPGEGPSGWGPASYFKFPGALGSIGVISPLSHHFCGECNRLRLTADGRLRMCLFSDEELDARAVLRTGDAEAVQDLVREALRLKPEGHEQRRGTARRMSQIGG
ncbi:MAG: GTP 3',8-cyclase MoaA [Coriobacteriia bacterium]